MQTAAQIIRDGILPSRDEEFFEIVTDVDGFFSREESEFWDFKQSWPDRYSEEYFHSLARLVCGFHNARGGLIIFGVHDESRKGGANKIIVDLDKFKSSLNQILDRSVGISYRRYISPVSGTVDVILVPTKSKQSNPIRFIQNTKKYSKEVIWVRKGHEVCEAGPKDISTLYCNTVFGDEVDTPMAGQLPPSPATVKQFVGRMSVIDDVFSWIFERDEPRAFLWGKGGSGKSTIAYEIARQITQFGKGLVIDDSDVLEQVIYLSAKSTYLNIQSNKSEVFLGNDFEDERSLYEAILILGASNDSDLSEISIIEIRRKIEDFFDKNSCFIVIDDIDTVTTANKDSGMEFLARASARSTKKSKILYTTRNRPSFAIGNSIEVPGLSDKEYTKFVETCCRQFGVPPPPEKFSDGELRIVSERRPLVIESIVQLRKSCGSYEAAKNVFDQVHAQDVRRYVFDREWQSLDAADRGRELLALLAYYRRPIDFDDLCTMSKFDSQKVADALASVQEMFLTVDEGPSDKSLYSLGELTRSFIVEAARSLNSVDMLKARVEKFKATFYADSPALNSLLSRADRATYECRQGDSFSVVSLFKELDRGEFPPSITEDPRYHSLLAYLALWQPTPALDKARIGFSHAFAYKYAPREDYIRLWIERERSSDQSETQIRQIESLVRKSNGYTSDFRWEITSRVASFLYNHGRDIAFEMPERSLEILEESIDRHLRCFKRFSEKSFGNRDVSHERGRNTCFYYLNLLGKGEGYDRFFRFINRGIDSSKDWFLDPIVEPFSFASRNSFQRNARTKSELQRIIGRMDVASKNWVRPDLWCDISRSVYVTKIASNTKESAKERIGLLKSDRSPW